MTQDLHWNTPLISRSRADILRIFDGFTLVEPGLVPPARWRPDLDNPLVSPREDDDAGRRARTRTNSVPRAAQWTTGPRGQRGKAGLKPRPLAERWCKLVSSLVIAWS